MRGRTRALLACWIAVGLALGLAVGLGACREEDALTQPPIDPELKALLVDDIARVRVVAHLVLGRAKVIDTIGGPPSNAGPISAAGGAGENCGYAIVEAPATVLEVFRGTTLGERHVRAHWFVECPVRLRLFTDRDVVFFAEEVQFKTFPSTLTALENSTWTATPEVLATVRGATAGSRQP
jgi:hypothetical protein